MARFTPAQVREKHAANTKAARQRMIDGIAKVTEAPGAKAAAQAEKMLINLEEAVRSGRWGDAVSKVTLAEWKVAMTEKGVNRVGPGIDAAAGKIEEFFDELLAYQDTYLAEIRRMPDLTIDDSRARMNKNFDKMSQFKKGGK